MLTELAEKTKTQDLDWMSFLLEDGLRQWFYTSPHVQEALPRQRKDVEEKKTSLTAAAVSLLGFLQDRDGN